MSPGIGVSVPLPARTPRLAVFAAIAEMRARGTALAFGDPGVVRGPAHAQARDNTWIRDRRAVGVSVIGAVLLSTQPQPQAEDECELDAISVAARALGVELAFADGLGDGWSMEPTSRYLTGSINRAQYLRGFELGARARVMATVVCSACEALRFKGQLRCHGCGR